MIPIAKPWFGREELAFIQDSLVSGWVTQGPKVKEFERLFAEKTGAKHAIAVSSCTSALELALNGVEEGTGVLVPALTFVATFAAAERSGITPIPVDIEYGTWNMDAGTLAEVLEKSEHQINGVVPVHLFGYPCDMDPIMSIANEYDLFTIEDAACGFDSYYRGRHVGTFGNAGCFSFHPRKSLTTGEGGMITTNDDTWAPHLRALREHGAVVSDHLRHESKGFNMPDIPYLGTNARMTDIQGAIGIAQMRKSVEMMYRRRQLATRYDDLLADLEWIHVPEKPPMGKHGYQAYVIHLDVAKWELENAPKYAKAQVKLFEFLESKGVQSRPGTHAPPFLKAYEDHEYKPTEFPNAYLAERATVAIPLFSQMTEEEQDTVIAAVRGAKSVCVG